MQIHQIWKEQVLCLAVVFCMPAFAHWRQELAIMFVMAAKAGIQGRSPKRMFQPQRV
jgi:hypothetical protein